MFTTINLLGLVATIITGTSLLYIAQKLKNQQPAKQPVVIRVKRKNEDE